MWRKRIRPDTLAKAKERCEVCGSKSSNPLLCHDKWVYDDKKAIATLADFEMHCEFCDLVTHIGQKMKVKDPKIVFLVAVGHLSKVNKCDGKVAIDILRSARDIWEKRNQKTWQIRVAPELLERYPELDALPAFKPSESL